MHPETITPAVVHETLRAIRSAKRLRGTPLIGLAALGRRLAAEGLADTLAGRAGLLPQWLEEVTWDRVAGLRGQDRDDPSRLRSVERLLALVTTDFHQHNPDREAWGVIHFRYFSGANYSVQGLAEYIGVSHKTLCRRIERGYQVLADALQSIESATTAGAAPGQALPVEPTPFIGREAELAGVRQLLVSHRCVTLAGPGGIGKSRMALRLARDRAPDFVAGARFVDLSALVEGRQLPRAVATALGLVVQAGTTPSEAVQSYLADKHLLLVLDNCEHLVSAVDDLVRAVVGGCPQVQVLATSREALHVDNQATYPMPPMALPAEPEGMPVGSVRLYDGVRLFCRQTAAARPDRPVDDASVVQVARLCSRLDGIPLAIELAAAQSRRLTLDQIEGGLADRFTLLRDGQHATRPGHETMRAVLDGSFKLLSRSEQALFMRLSVFQGGWTLEAAEAVCAGEGVARDAVLDLLAELDLKSMVVVSYGPQAVRYRFLETVRAYAGDRLKETGERAAWKERHLAYFLELAESASEALQGPGQVQWLRRLEVDEDNLDVALRWARTPERIERGLRLASALARNWYIRGRFDICTTELADMLAVERAAEAGAAYANTLTWAGWIAARRSETELAEHLSQQALHCWRELGDARGEIGPLNTLAVVARQRGEFRLADSYIHASIALNRELGGTEWTMLSILIYAGLLNRLNDPDAARQMLEEALPIARAQGDQHALASLLSDLGLNVLKGGDDETARRHLQEDLDLRRSLDDRLGTANALLNFSNIPLLRGESRAALRYCEESLAIYREIGDHWGEALAQGGLAEAYLFEGMIGEAEPRLRLYITSARESGNPPVQCEALEKWAELEQARSCSRRALWTLGAVVQAREELGLPNDRLRAALVTRVEEAARSALGDQEAARALAEGRSLDLAEALACALGERAWPFDDA